MQKPTEILTTLKKITKVVYKTMQYTAVYLCALVTIEAAAVAKSQKIEPSQLEATVAEERKKLGITDDVTIETKIAPGTSFSKKIGDKQYTICIGDLGLNDSTVKHELYHIADGHCDAIKENWRIISMIKYLFWYEPKAAIYELTH